MTFEPQNSLEIKLMLAATDPSARIEFYRELQISDIFVIRIKEEDELAEEGILKEGTKVNLFNIEMNGKYYLPIFSSLIRLQEFIKHEVTFLTMNSMDFFKLTLGTEIVLNPGASYGKEFQVKEIESIINGTIFESNRYEVKADTQVMIGQPSNPPEELLKELKNLFSSIKEVKSAYNAHFYNPEMDEKPHTLIAVEMTGDWSLMISQAGKIADRVKIPDPPVDFIHLNGKSNLEEYFKESKPFYRKKILGIF